MEEFDSQKIVITGMVKTGETRRPGSEPVIEIEDPEGREGVGIIGRVQHIEVAEQGIAPFKTPQGDIGSR